MTRLLISAAINRYAEAFTTPESKPLAALNRETHVKVEHANMLSGHVQGAILSMLSHMIRPKRVLEIGTYTGYSAICLAQGLTEDGHLHTIDVNEELQDMSFRYFCEAGLDNKITQHIGKAAEIIPALNEQFDLVFIDADKKGYSNYYDLVFDKVPVGGFILADNVLFEGEVTLPVEEQSGNAKAVDAFNKKVSTDKRVEHVLMPVRDGIMLIRKIAH